MKPVSLGLVLLAVALSPLGCRNPFVDESVVLAVSNLEAPSAALPRTAVTVVLTVWVIGCERFDHIGQVRLDSQIVLTAVGKNAGKNVVCPQGAFAALHSVVIEDPPGPPFTVAVVQPRGAPPLRAEIALGAVMD